MTIITAHDLATFAAAVAAQLGAGWTVVDPEPGAATHWRRVNGPNGERLWTNNSHHRDALVWTGDFESPLRKPYNADPCSIKVGNTRAPEAHAKEITRRLLPQYRALLEQARATRAREEDQDRARDALADQIARLMPKPDRRRPSQAEAKSGDSITFDPYTDDCGHGDVRVGNTGTYVDLHLNLPPSIALALLATWKLARDAFQTHEQEGA